jgi:hypothetical protein
MDVHVARNFRQFCHFACSDWRTFYPTIFLSRVDDYTEDVVTFSALAKV